MGKTLVFLEHCGCVAKHFRNNLLLWKNAFFRRIQQLTTERMFADMYFAIGLCIWTTVLLALLKASSDLSQLFLSDHFSWFEKKAAASCDLLQCLALTFIFQTIYAVCQIGWVQNVVGLLCGIWYHFVQLYEPKSAHLFMSQHISMYMGFANLYSRQISLQKWAKLAFFKHWHD